MHCRTLGSTGLKVSVIGIGTWQFGGEWNKDFQQDEVNAMFARGKALGINLIDTAECYGDHLSESYIGKSVSRERADWIIASKFGHKFHGYMNRTDPRRPQDCLQQLEESLTALRTDYIDILQYHSWGNDQFFDDDVLALMHKAKDQGKFRHLGNSVGSNQNVKQVEASQGRGIEVIQIIYNRLDRAPEETCLPICRQQNLGVLARVPLASGYLSAKYKPVATFEKGDVRSGHKKEEVDARLNEVQRIAQEEVTAGVPMARWALAWVLKNPAVTSVIPGCKSVEQVEENARAADLLEV
ncbi:MAG TPA: aldo/keto reductase [Tepidisphaeraceae bacterium]|jgi:aryl-alcohol dehydrogenase-like predicted oxidoreductase